MDFIKETWNKAKALQKTIVLPETEDARVLKAAELIVKSKLAKIILIGAMPTCPAPGSSIPINIRNLISSFSSSKKNGRLKG